MFFIYGGFTIEFISKRYKYLSEKYQKLQKMQFREYSFGYKILGEGSSSVVYKAKKNRSKEQFAIKFIKQDFLKSELEKRLISNQIKIHESLKNHENIVNLFQHGKYGNSYVFVFQYCQKGSLADILQNGKILSQVQAVYIVKQVIKAYKVLYQKKILHRDIKPGNILITQKNQIKLCDFGLSIKLEQNFENEMMKIGTPCFLAPQIAKQNIYTYKADFWAIGITFFRMIKGQLPYKSYNYQNFLKQIKQINIENLIPQNISQQSKQFIIKTLKQNHHQRISAEQFFNFDFQSSRSYTSLNPCKSQAQIKKKRVNQSFKMERVNRQQKLNINRKDLSYSYSQKKLNFSKKQLPIEFKKQDKKTQCTESSQINEQDHLNRVTNDCNEVTKKSKENKIQKYDKEREKQLNKAVQVQENKQTKEQPSTKLKNQIKTEQQNLKKLLLEKQQQQKQKFHSIQVIFKNKKDLQIFLKPINNQNDREKFSRNKLKQARIKQGTKIVNQQTQNMPKKILLAQQQNKKQGIKSTLKSTKQQNEKVILKQMELITKIIMNQIDLLRFSRMVKKYLYKYFKNQFLYLKSMIQYFTFSKIQLLRSFSFVEPYKLNQYKQFPLYLAWVELIDDYQTHIKNCSQLQFSQNQRIQIKDLENLIQNTIKQIFLQFDRSIKNKYNAGKLITLDYLICFKDLLEMSKKGQNYFLKNSMLNIILQGFQKLTIQHQSIDQIFIGISKKLMNLSYF